MGVPSRKAAPWVQTQCRSALGGQGITCHRLAVQGGPVWAPLDMMVQYRVESLGPHDECQRPNPTTGADTHDGPPGPIFADVEQFTAIPESRSCQPERCRIQVPKNRCQLASPWSNLAFHLKAQLTHISDPIRNPGGSISASPGQSLSSSLTFEYALPCSDKLGNTCPLCQSKQ